MLSTAPSQHASNVEPRPFVVTRALPQGATHVSAHIRRDTTLFTLLALFAVLNIGDLVSTFVGIQGGMREGNPLMSALLTHYGFGALIVYKALVIVAVTVGISMLRNLHALAALITLWVCNLLVFFVVVMNVVQFNAIR
ncbi:MAG: hypothetical protein OJF49_001105 [Ktedonobacterales bacterium]|jgi:hypothetical protein|nr:MAG: hypothetical protein OJF49_001105 [Ktedonobacterales bacterium]